MSKEVNGPAVPESLRLAIAGTGRIPLVVGLLSGVGIFVQYVAGGSPKLFAALVIILAICAVWLGVNESRGRGAGRRLRAVARWILDLFP